MPAFKYPMITDIRNQTPIPKPSVYVAIRYNLGQRSHILTQLQRHANHKTGVAAPKVFAADPCFHPSDEIPPLLGKYSRTSR